MRFVVVPGMFLNPGFKITTCFTYLVATATSTSKFGRKYFKDVTGKILNYQENILHMKNNFQFCINEKLV